MYVTHGLFNSIEIQGTKINIYQCRNMPDQEDIAVYGRSRFQFDNKENVFYEAYLSGSNKPFFSSKEEPTSEELEFQLNAYNKSPILNFMKSLFS